MKVKAGILPFVIAISLIISVICSAFILVMYYYNLIGLKYNNDVRVLNNLGSVQELILSTGADNYAENNLVSIDLFGEGNDSVTVIKKSWGGFDLFLAEAFCNKSRRRSVFMSANKTSVHPSVALYLSDNQGMYLSLVGYTVINGDAFLPRQGVQAGYVLGKSFSGFKLVNGNINRSSSSIPELNIRIKDVFTNLTNLLLLESGTDYFAIEKLLLVNSFRAPTLKLYSQQPIVITKKLQGNIIVCSQTEIIISSQCSTDNIILVAPKITVKSNFQGNFQAFSTHQIIIEDNVSLEYPTLLFCNNNEGSLVSLGFNTVLVGGIYHHNFLGNSVSNPGNVLIHQSTVIGQLITTGSVELCGKIDGQLMCNKSILKDNNNKVYENYLIDSEIDIYKVPPYYLFPPVLVGQEGNSELLRKL